MKREPTGSYLKVKSVKRIQFKNNGLYFHNPTKQARTRSEPSQECAIFTDENYLIAASNGKFSWVATPERHS